MSENRRLNSWKEIASYLDHDVRTVIRWEKERGMPVHRVPGGQRHGVFAYSGEIDEWLHNGRPVDDDSPPRRPGGKVEQAFVFDMHPAADAAPASSRGQAPPAAQPSIASSRYPAQSEPAPALPSIQLPVENKARSDDRTTYSAPVFNLSFPLLLKSALAVVAVAALVWAITLYFGNKSQVRASTRVRSVSWKGERLDALNEKNETLWTHDFPRHKNTLAQNGSTAYVGDLDGDGKEEVLVAIRFDDADPIIGNPTVRLYCFSKEGKILWELTPQSEVNFGAGQYGAPWGLTSWDVYKISGETRILLASNHKIWWPSFLTVLDARGRVVERFVNSGWIHNWQWLPRPQGSLLLVAGFSNSNNCGMLAVLDPNHISGSSPEQPGSLYECKNCPAGRPLHYFVFPRSEINQVMGCQYNQAGMGTWVKDGFGVDTTECRINSLEGDFSVDAVYEFSRDVELKHAYFTDKYWDYHRRLEYEGKIKHSRERCPDRNGPRVVRSWDAVNGWREIRPAFR